MKKTSILLSSITLGCGIFGTLSLSANGISVIKPILTPIEINKEYILGNGGSINMSDISIENHDEIITANNSISKNLKDNNPEDVKKFFNFVDNQLNISADTIAGNYNFSYEVCSSAEESPKEVTGGFLPAFSIQNNIIFPPPGDTIIAPPPMNPDCIDNPSPSC